MAKNFEASQIGHRVAELEKTVSALSQRNQELEALLKMKSKLISNLEHEVRTLLVAIHEYTRAVLDGRAGQISDLWTIYFFYDYSNPGIGHVMVGPILDFLL